MKRREFIKTSCKYALLCTSPLALGTLQSCEDVDTEYTNNNDPITPPIDGGNDSGGNDSSGGSGTYLQFDISSSSLQDLQSIGGSATTESNAADPNGFLLYRATDTVIYAFTRKCTHVGSSVGAFVNGISTCPNHRAQFDLSGNVVGGPARSALRKYNTSLSGNVLKVFYTES